MDRFNWVEDGDKFILKVAGGRAVIQQTRDTTNHTVFTAGVQTDDGTVVESWPEPFREFEDAESFAMSSLIYFDMPPDAKPDDEPDAAKLDATLRLCIDLIPVDYPDSHRARLELIRQWVHDKHDKRSREKRADWSGFRFEWAYTEKLATAPTPYGVIRMVGPSDFPYIRLTAPCGVEYENSQFMGTFRSFEDAEIAARELLNEVDNPSVEEAYFSNLEFTLAICRKLMPPNTDAMHVTRLDYVMMRLSDILL